MTISLNSSYSKVVVISQSMYFPWCGFLDIVRLSDTFVHYDDVQLSRGFYNRVQVKKPKGTSFITVPIKDRHQKQLINQSYIDYSSDWIGSHRASLIESYSKTNFINEAIDIFDEVHKDKYEVLSDLSSESIKVLLKYFGIDKKINFSNSIDINAKGVSSERLLNIAKSLKASVYLTGHGALNYLDHDLFEKNGIEVQYINYFIEEYSQLYGEFTPYVTALDAIAHLGPNVSRILKSTSVNWREALVQPDMLRA